jgi:hypothetical protein
VVKDPIAGQRQAVNDHKAASLLWVDSGQPCPVSVGDIFELRSCRIQITKTHRIKHGGQPKWRAAFDRYDRKSDRLHLLTATGDYTEDPDLALGLREDVHDAATLDPIAEEDRSHEHKNAGEPLEPEAVPPHEIPHYQGSVDARHNYLLEMSKERMAEQAEPLELRLLRLRQEARSRHVDISSEVRVIEKRIEAAERKVLERAA